MDRANDFISVLKFAQTYKNVLPNSEILTAESHGAEGALIAAAPNNPTSQPDGLNINLIAVTYPGCGYAGLDNLFGNPQGGTWKLGSTPLYSLTGDSDTTTPYAECSQRQTTAETTWSISSTMLNFAKFPGATHAFMGTYDTQANIAARAMAIQEIGKLMDAAKAGKAKIP